MSKLCNKCGQVLEDELTVCPYCGREVEPVVNENNNIEDIIEVPIVNQTDNSTLDGTIPLVMAAPTLDDIKPVNEIENIAMTSTPSEVVTPVEVQTPEAVPVVEAGVAQEPTVEEVTPVEETQPVEVQTSEVEMPEVPEIEKIDEKEKLEIPTPEINITTTPVVVETAPKLGDVNDILTTVEVEVENNSLETVSIEANEKVLVEEEEVFEIPVMPEPSIGEINPELLGNKYDNEEQANQEKLEAKKKMEEQEQERRLQEELAKREIPMERPDLLAGFGQPDTTVEVEEPKTKKTGGKKAGLIVAILVILVIGGLAAWFVLSGGLDKLLNKEPKYLPIDPVNTYYEGFNEGNSEKIISSFVPCLANSDNVSNIVTNSLNMKNQNPNMKITFSETNTEVVNGDDTKHLDKHLLDNCSSKPEISDYKHIFIEQKTKLNTDSKEELSETEFWVAQIEEKWYIIMIQ